MNISEFVKVNTSTSREKYVGDEGLKSYIRKVYNYMMSSLGLTAIVSYLVLRAGILRFLFSYSASGEGVVGYSLLGYLVIFSPLAISLFMRFNKSLSVFALKVCMFLLAAMEGASISVLILYAGVHNAFQAFLLSGILFGSMSLYGYITNKDLLSIGSFLTMALWGLIIVSIFGMFTGGVGIWFSYVAVLIFTVLVAYDTQNIKKIYSAIGAYGEDSEKVAVFCALNLYLDFINIFIHLLRILSKNNRR